MKLKKRKINNGGFNLLEDIFSWLLLHNKYIRQEKEEGKNHIKRLHDSKNYIFLLLFIYLRVHNYFEKVLSAHLIEFFVYWPIYTNSCTDTLFIARAYK